MLEWLKENLGTLIIAALLATLVAGIIIRLVKRKKQGKCLGCDACNHCSNKKECPSNKNT